MNAIRGIVTSLALTAFVLPSSVGVAQDQSGVTVERFKVLVLPFVNLNQDDAYGYFIRSLPTSIEFQLRNTDQFDFVELDTAVEVLNDLGIDPTEWFDNQTAQTLEDSLGADVVVMGQFAVVFDEDAGSEHFKAQVKVVNVSDPLTGPQVAIVEDRNGPMTGSATLRVVDEFAATLAQNMERTFAPREVLAVERLPYTLRVDSHDIGPAESVSLEGDMTDWQNVAMQNVDGFWEAQLMVPLLPGESFRYRLLADGEPRGGVPEISFEVRDNQLEPTGLNGKLELHVQLGASLGFLAGPGLVFLPSPQLFGRFTFVAFALNKNLEFGLGGGWFRFVVNPAFSSLPSVASGFETSYSLFPVIPTIGWRFATFSRWYGLQITPRLGAGGVLRLFRAFGGFTGETQTELSLGWAAEAAVQIGWRFNQTTQIYLDISTRPYGYLDDLLWTVDIAAGFSFSLYTGN